MNNETDISNLLRKLLKEQTEIHELVAKIDRRQRWTRNINILYVVIIILGALGFYSVARPYFKTVIEVFESAQSNFSVLKSVGETLKK